LKVGEKKAFPIGFKQKSESILNLIVMIEGASVSNSKINSVNCFFTKFNKVIQTSDSNIYQAMFEAATDGIVIELNNKIIFANNSFARIFGYKDVNELKEKNILELVSEESLTSVDEFLKKKRTFKPEKERLEFLARKKDGLIMFAEFCAFELRENQQLYLVLMAKDVGERKRMQEAAKDSEQKYRNIAENIDDLLYTFERFDDRMFPTYYSKAIEKITGYTQTDFLSDQRLFLKIIHPDDFRDMKKRLSFLWKSDAQVTTEFEFRIINKSGNVVWIRNKINVVRDSEGKIRKIYGLISDITFNKRAEEELRQSAANLKKLNDAKDRFLSIISHDLRAPFSSILGFTDLLLEDDTLTDTEKEQYISYIQDSSKSMLSLVNSMLDWTRLQTGRIKFEPEKLNAREIIESSISTISGTALKKGVEIENLVDPALHIFGDKNLILQAFNNLLSNAVKFTKLGDRIMISVNTSPSSRFISFSVKDTGTGIKSSNIEKLFSIETKFTSEGTAGEKGSGLGLSLVKEIIEKHGGKIEVLSEFEKGTEFIFTIPIASTKILLIDANNRERMFYSKVLINITTDYAINVVSNGKEALERIIQSPPALVITEHKMPIMSGLQLVKELIKINLLDAIPVIVLAGEIERSEIQEYTELGIEYVFNKPVNLISLKAAIEKSLKKRNK
jgi:PAS domain S-box-containing protein